MFRTPPLSILMAAVLGLVFPAAASSQEIKGQLKVGIHKVKLEKGKLYEVIVDSSATPPPRASLGFMQDHIVTVFGKNFQEPKYYFLPSKSDTFTFYVQPDFGPQKDETIDYTLKFKAVEFEKPLVEE